MSSDFSTKQQIEIDPESGFCFGVVTAIKKAEEELEKGKLYCLGDIVHNGQEVNRLEKLGLQTIMGDNLQDISCSRILFRAHGEPPATYKKAKANGNEIVDATCPVVLNLQKRIREQYLQTPQAQIVIFGKRGHAEVIGLQGQTDNTAIVIEHLDEINNIDFNKDIYLFSQTTKSVDEFEKLVAAIEQRIEKEQGLNQPKKQRITFCWHDTICRQVRNRTKHLQQFALTHDRILFVGGHNSSNGHVLFSQCKEVNDDAVYVSSPQEITEQYILASKGKTIGICGATSTPKWLMQACADKLKEHLILTKV
ncbi:MAG: 4-hydroxy-3-methylbut-2-enyl diphosphate reductase [Paludibacteraceae bacterium]|nr:4-hydroxy-3-methylbut-2-enyl diphosphate reductase [Paludibacteraceae bacterium]